MHHFTENPVKSIYGNNDMIILTEYIANSARASGTYLSRKIFKIHNNS